MIRRCLLPIIFTLLWVQGVAQTSGQWQPTLSAAIYQADTELLPELLANLPDSLRPFLTHPDSFRLQIVYTRILPAVGRSGKARLKHHTFNLNPSAYFFPASTLKLPLAALVLEELSAWSWPIGTLDYRMTLHAPDTCRAQTVDTDPHAPRGIPTLRTYIQDLLVYSDNRAFHRLFELLGADTFHKMLSSKGLNGIRVNRYPSQGCRPDRLQSYHVLLTCDDGRDTLLFRPSRLEPPPLPNLFCDNQVGIGVMNDEDGSITAGPLDFSYMNSAQLADLHSVMLALIVPEALPASQRFALRPDYHQFLLQTLATEPNELRLPTYDSAQWAGHPGKYLYWGALRDSAFARWEALQKISYATVTIRNKVGQAYGFLSDVAYLRDDNSGAACVVSATLYVNSDGILNDDKYEYSTRGWPFLAWIGQRLLLHSVQTKPWSGPPYRCFE